MDNYCDDDYDSVYDDPDQYDDSIPDDEYDWEFTSSEYNHFYNVDGWCLENVD